MPLRDHFQSPVDHFSSWEEGVRAETWQHELIIGLPPPTLPLYLSETLRVPLERETT